MQGLLILHPSRMVARRNGTPTHTQAAAKLTNCMEDHMHLICKPMLMSNWHKCLPL